MTITILIGNQKKRLDLDGYVLDHISFEGMNLSNASFRGTYIFSCCFNNANLEWADFCGTDIKRSSFRNAFFKNSIFSGTNLFDIDFKGAKFIDYFGFNGAIANNVNFEEAEIPPNIFMTCPDEGDFIGWKKAFIMPYHQIAIVKLLIPADAKRSSSIGRKCRCDKAVVLGIESLDGRLLPDDTVALSIFDPGFTYKKGDTIKPELPFEENRWRECASGIHFFINRQEAVEYSS